MEAHYSVIPKNYFSPGFSTSARPSFEKLRIFDRADAFERRVEKDENRKNGFSIFGFPDAGFLYVMRFNEIHGCLAG